MLQTRWNVATSRERLIVIAAALFVLAALVFALLVRPASRTVLGAPAALHALDAKINTMRTQAAQLRAAPAAVTASATIVTAALAERDLAGVGATVYEVNDSSQNAGGGSTVTVKGVDSARFAAWLAKPDVQRQLQRLTITRDAASGRVTGTIGLRKTP